MVAQGWKCWLDSRSGLVIGATFVRIGKGKQFALYAIDLWIGRKVDVVFEFEKSGASG